MAQEVVKTLFSHGLFNMTPDRFLKKGRGAISVSMIGEFRNFSIHFTDSRFVPAIQSKD